MLQNLKLWCDFPKYMKIPYHEYTLFSVQNYYAYHIKLPLGYVGKGYIKQKWFSYLDLGLTIKISHYVLTNISKVNKTPNIKHFWSQPLWIWNTEPVSVKSTGRLFGRKVCEKASRTKIHYTERSFCIPWVTHRKRVPQGNGTPCLRPHREFIMELDLLSISSESSFLSWHCPGACFLMAGWRSNETTGKEVGRILNKSRANTRKAVRLEYGFPWRYFQWWDEMNPSWRTLKSTSIHQNCLEKTAEKLNVQKQLVLSSEVCFVGL